MPTSHSTSRAVLYLRVSTASQAEQGTSLDEQRRDLLDYAEHRGLEVVEVVEDAGKSAADLDRPGMARALEMIESGEADVLVASKIDRVARNLRDLLNLAHELQEAGASIVLADDTLDTTTAQGRLHSQIMGAFAEWERELIAARLKAGRDAARAKGTRFGRPPVGLTSKRGKLVVADSDEARERVALARRAASMKRNGSTLQAIADAFIAEGIPTGSGRPGTRWHPSSVSRLLKTAAAAPA